MSTRINYTAAELESFRILPKTCPTIEAAFERTFAIPSLSDEDTMAIFAKYGITADWNMLNAIYEVMGRYLFKQKTDLLQVVQLHGTFPLRLAHVQAIEEDMRRRGQVVEPNHYVYWIESWLQRQNRPI